MLQIAHPMPARLRAAQTLCRMLPPLLAQKVRTWVYPADTAYHDNYEFVVRAQTGSQFRSRTSDFHGYRFGVHGYYDWRNWAVAIAICRPGDTVIEVGANIGTETVGFSDIVGPAGSVHAFEPLPSNISALNQLIELNQLRNVKVHTCALGDEKKNAQFVLPANKGASGIGHLLGRNEPATTSINVEVRTLDELGTAIGRAKLIVIDAEGAEVSIIQGAKRYLADHQPFLVLEASPKWLARAGATVEDLNSMLAGLGYEVFGIGRTNLLPITNTDNRKAGNWFCAPPGCITETTSVRRHLSVCGWLPCIRGVNPLSKGIR